jgi:hypothetical protein
MGFGPTAGQMPKGKALHRTFGCRSVYMTLPIFYTDEVIGAIASYSTSFGQLHALMLVNRRFCAVVEATRDAVFEANAVYACLKVDVTRAGYSRKHVTKVFGRIHAVRGEPAIVWTTYGVDAAADVCCVREAEREPYSALLPSFASTDYIQTCRFLGGWCYGMDVVLDSGGAITRARGPAVEAARPVMCGWRRLTAAERAEIIGRSDCVYLRAGHDVQTGERVYYY